MHSFTRTPAGQAASYLFYKQEEQVLVWVEGKTDIPLFRKLLAGRNCVIKEAGCRDKCLKLAEKMKHDNLPYVVVIDGDYSILSKTRSPHHRQIILDRYSCESYLFEKEIVEKVIMAHAQAHCDTQTLHEEYEEAVDCIQKGVVALLTLDIAHKRSNSGRRILPKNAKELLSDNWELDSNRILYRCFKSRKGITRTNILEAKTSVDEFLNNRRLLDLMPGHLLFSFLRALVMKTTESITGGSHRLDNAWLRAILVSEIKFSLTKDHNNLRRRLFNATKSASILITS